MRICYHCQPPRVNLGHPDFCQFCGTSFQYRICLHCRAHNSADAVRCGACGRGELSELGTPMPAWVRLLTLLFWGGLVFLVWQGATWGMTKGGEMMTQLMWTLLPLAIGLALFLALLPPSLREMVLFVLRALCVALGKLTALVGRGLMMGVKALFFGGAQARRR